jgi:cytochrome c553
MLIVQESRNATCRRLLREAAALLIAIGSVPAWFESGLRAEDARASDHFEKRVRPLLIERCHKCHAAEKTKGGLRLDSAKSLRQGGESGAVVVPGKPDESLLIQAVRHENGLKMPPDGKLNAAQIADLVTWVKSGAVWANADSVAPSETPVPADKDVPLQNQIEATRARFTSAERNFWAFQPVKDVSPPDVTAVDWIATPIDRFILIQLEANGLHPAAAADKRTLIRRVAFDLTGLPPAPEEIGAFLKDESAEAYEKVVKRLLDSPHYGERWGRHWLDVVRYADSTANDANAVMRYAWRYRNYVIDAFNRDLPYDQFLIEQLAGDLLPPSDDISTRLRRTIATGFLMVGPKALAETDKEQSRLDIVDDQMDVTGRALLGLTLACARCHDHKFDAIRAVDYYAMAGIFRSTEPFQDEARNSSMWWEFPLFQAPGEKPFMVMAPKEATPRNLRVHLRGNRFTLGALVPRGFLQIISPEPPDLDPSHSGRLELARWITSPQNPLTARVMVNRIWQHHFGRGIVATSDNFGVRGERPTHPELLDFLAGQFVSSGWSIKKLHREIVLSSVYRQQSRPSETARQVDPDNQSLSWFPNRRLSAEELRDSVLAISGQLDRESGTSEAQDILWKEAEVQDEKRGFAPNRMAADHPFYTEFRKRSIYLPVVRNMLPDVLALFDGADPNNVTAIRNDTTVPSQSLFLLNSRFIREQSRHFAQTLLADDKASDEQRCERAHLKALGRGPSADEQARSKRFLEAHLQATAAQARPAADRRLSAWQSYCQTLFCANEFLYLE